jgi:hypothetical protein
MALIARDRNVLIDDRERRRGPYLSRTFTGSANNLHMWDIKPYTFPQRIIVITIADAEACTGRG